MADPSVKVKITGDNSELVSSLKDATAGLKKWGMEAENSMKGLGSVVSNLKAPFLAVGAVIGGGAFLKKAADQTVSWTLEVNKLSKSLGISTQAASGWAVALHALGIEADTLQGVTNKLNMMVSAGGNQFSKWGVNVKDSNGHVKNNANLIMELSEKYNSLGSQTDRNIMLADIFGRKQTDAMAIFRLTAERIKESTEEARAFGLEVGPDGVAKAREYKESINKIGLISLSVSNMLGKELLPIITNIGKWFGENGPAMMQVFSATLKQVQANFYTFKFAIEAITTVASAMVMILVDGFSSVASALNNLVHGNFKEAIASLKQGAREIKAEFLAMTEGVAEAWQKREKAVADLHKESKAQPGTPDNNGTVPLKGDSESESQRLQKDFEAWKYYQEKKAAEEGQYRQISTKEQIAWLEENKNRYALKGSAEVSIDKQILDLKRKNLKEEFDARVAGYETQIVAAKGNYQKQIEIAQERLEKIKTFYGAESKEAEEAAKKVQEIRNKEAEEVKKVNQLKLEASREHSLALIALEEQAAQEQRAKFEISESQLIAKTIEFENRRFEIALRALKDRLALNTLEGADRQKVLNDIAALEDAHFLKLNQMTTKAKDQMDSSDLFGGLRLGFKKYADSIPTLMEQGTNTAMSLMNSMRNGFSNTLSSIMSGQMSATKAMQALWKSLSRTVLKSIADIIAAEITKWTLQKAISIWNTADTAKTAAENTTKTSTNTMAAASGIFQAHSSIPWVGVAIALGFIAIMMAAMNQFTGRKVGGLVGEHGPEATVLGEDGLEVVAPERDFRHYMERMYADVQERQTRIMSNKMLQSLQVNPIEQLAATMQGQSQAQQIHNYDGAFKGAIFIGTSQESTDMAARKMAELNRYYNQRYA